MPQTIWKFPLAAETYQEIEMPAGAQILSVAEQNQEIVLYAKVWPMRDKAKRAFWIFGTGHQIINDAAKAAFIGTVKLYGGDLMFHVFDGGGA